MTAGATDLGRLLDTAPWSAYQKYVVGLVAAAMLFDGLDGQVLGLAIPALIEDWGVTRAGLAPVVAAGLIGMCIGAALGGSAADRFGRKRSLIASVVLFGVATTVSALVDTVGWLGVARFVVGLGLGGALPVATALIAEFTPTRSRSIGLAVGMLTIPIGSMIGGLISAAIIEDLGWRALFAIGGLLPLVLAVGLTRLLPESPQFLLTRPDRRNELARLLAKTHPESDVPGAALRAGPDTGKARAPLAALLGAEARLDTLRTWVAFFFTMLALYTVVSWGPAMLASESFALSFTGTALAAFALGGIVGSAASGWLIAWTGSRPSQLVLGGGGAIVAGIGAALFVDGAPGPGTVVAVIFVLGFAVTGMQNGMYILSAHLYPTAVRGTGVGAALTVARLGAVASSVTGALSVDLGGGALFFVFIAVALATAAATAAAVGRPVPARERGTTNLGG
jgi:AAHS family 4-hydroxybenzoate transporter-like MFS transporter